MPPRANFATEPLKHHPLRYARDQRACLRGYQVVFVGCVWQSVPYQRRAQHAGHAVDDFDNVLDLFSLRVALLLFIFLRNQCGREDDGENECGEGSAPASRTLGVNPGHIANGDFERGTTGWSSRSGW